MTSMARPKPGVSPQYQISRKELQERRYLDNYEKYQRVWQQYEKKIDGHFDLKERAKKNPNPKDEALIKVDIARKFKKTMTQA